MFGPDTRESDNTKPRGIQLPSWSTMENSDPVEHWCLQVLARRLARELLGVSHNPLSMVRVSLCWRQKEPCQNSQVHFTEELIQLLAFHAPGVQSKSMLLRVWLGEGHFHYSCQTKGFTLFSLQPLYTHWNLLPYSERRKVLACSYFISELLFFLLTECIFKGWAKLWH